MVDGKVDHRVQVAQVGYIPPLWHENDETESLAFDVEAVRPRSFIHQPARPVLQDISQLGRIPVTKIARTIQKDQQRPFLLPRDRVTLG